MALNPAQLLMQRRGPALGPGDTGSAPLAGSASPTPDAAGAPGGMLTDILGKMLEQQNTVDQSYIAKQIGNMKRLAAVMIAHLDQSHPEVARHMTRAYTALEAANTAAEKAGKASPTPQVGPPLGFSGAKLGGEPGTNAPPQGPLAI